MNKTIYIVDDDDNVLSALKWLFESMSFDVKTFLNAKVFWNNIILNMWDV